MSIHEAVSAYPVGSNASKALQRAMATRRFAYCLDLAEDAQTLTVVDPADGTLPLYLIQDSILFRYDSTDTTTAHDGVVCLVTADNKRYKVSSVAFPYSVLNVTTAAQPVSPTLGDMYLVATAATGTDWAGKDGQIAVYTARGWAFIVAPIGRLLYAENTGSFWHKNAGGTWTLGFGPQALGAGSVLPSNMSGGGGKVRWFIENQTTNTPPGSPADLSEYIVGPSPTDAWSGKAAQIARYESAAWVFYAPAAGWKAYDKSLGYDVNFNGTAWVSAAGAISKITDAPVVASGSATSGAGTDTYTVYSDTAGPTSVCGGTKDDVTITHAANRAGAKIEFHYRALLQGDATGAYAVTLYRDDLTDNIDWYLIVVGASGYYQISGPLVLTAAPDTAAHTYYVKVHRIGGIALPALTRRYFKAEERA